MFDLFSDESLSTVSRSEELNVILDDQFSLFKLISLLYKDNCPVNYRRKSNTCVFILSYSFYSRLIETYCLDSFSLIESFLHTLLKHLLKYSDYHSIIFSLPIISFNPSPTLFFDQTNRVDYDTLTMIGSSLHSLSLKEQKLSLVDLSFFTGLDSYRKIRNYYRFSSKFDPMQVDKVLKLFKDTLYKSCTLRPKVLCLDLDHTLWSGILREDGHEGLKIGGHSPLGKLYHDIQSFFLALKNKGLLLALISKNNYSEVVKVFNNLSDMPLRLDDIVSFKVNNSPKSQNIIALSEELNISTDQFVFIDDSPFERLEVQTNVSGITVPDMPDNKYEWPLFLYNLLFFSEILHQNILTPLDRTRHYQTRSKRNTEKNQFLKHSQTNYTDWLRSISQVLIVNNVSIITTRLEELFLRTNQFNANLSKYSIDTLKSKTIISTIFEFSLKKV